MPPRDKKSPQLSTCELPPLLGAWRSLVNRSVKAWEAIRSEHDSVPSHLPSEALLRNHITLSAFLATYNDTSSSSSSSTSKKAPLFFFFQLRASFFAQEPVFTEWSRDDLDHDHPDPHGTDLRTHKRDLEDVGWDYVFVDWTCIPQQRHRHRRVGQEAAASGSVAPPPSQQRRAASEAAYARRCMRSIPHIIRSAGFTHHYPMTFEPRLWVLYEVMEFVLTSDMGFLETNTPDMRPFHKHAQEVVIIGFQKGPEGVQETLRKYGYDCADEADRVYLDSWIELLVSLREGLDLNVGIVRTVMDELTWEDPQGPYRIVVEDTAIEIDRSEGWVSADGETCRFTPLPAV
ncbi:hypothetical protein DM02DRAFT_669374 [Periconia macrospinosa]|uniref:Heterokaryon incompatibility domain-containing protein n=1 Tax=Periconia macrospinosa TaxID=97972 RepID=A0A2V1E0P8_9PLEO|nr:hypothetical protein DM02DRAFT_669374 [Periconia macrospinosa]